MQGLFRGKGAERNRFALPLGCLPLGDFIDALAIYLYKPIKFVGLKVPRAIFVARRDTPAPYSSPSPPSAATARTYSFMPSALTISTVAPAATF